MSFDVVLVACGKMKRAIACEARKMYCSPFFRETYAYALTLGGDVFIVSAKYGMIEPATKIEPYDQKLTAVGGARWGADVVAELVRKKGTQGRAALLCGELYARPIREQAKNAGVAWLFDLPMGRLGLGERRARMARAMRGDAAAPAANVAELQEPAAENQCGDVHVTGTACRLEAEHRGGCRGVYQGRVAAWFVSTGKLFEVLPGLTEVVRFGEVLHEGAERRGATWEDLAATG